MGAIHKVFINSSDRSVRSALGFGLSLALVFAVPHLFMLNSRYAEAFAPLACGVCALVLTAAACIRPLARIMKTRRALWAAAIAAAGSGYVFVLIVHPVVRAACLSVHLSAVFVLLLCWIGRIRCSSKQSAVLAVSAGTVVACSVELLVALTGSALGLRGNLAAYTTMSLCVHFALPIASALIGSLEGAEDNRGRGRGRDRVLGRSACESTCGNEGRWHAPLGFAELSLIVTICAASLIGSFFNGFAFNPYVLDIVAIDEARFALSALLAGMMFVCAASTDPARIHAVVSPFTALFLGMCTAGTALLSVDNDTWRWLFVTLVLSASDLLLMSIVIFSRFTDNRAFVSVRVAAVGIIAGGVPWAIALGMFAKRTLGFTLATITPPVLIAVAFLGIVSLAQNTRQASHISNEEARTDELMNMQLEDLTTVRIDEALGAYDLTGRERDVAALAMRNLSIAQIAERLAISPSTVSYHLTGVYRKTGIQSKADLPSLVEKFQDAIES